MKSSDLVEHISTKTGMDKAGVKKIIEAAVAALGDAARKGEVMTLTGFVRFKVKEVPARKERNPSTGKTLDIAASRKLAFTPTKPIRDALKA